MADPMSTDAPGSVVPADDADADRARRALAAVWRIESARIIATLTRFVGDVGQAEDLAQEAMLEAMRQWPTEGVPNNAGAWLTAVAKRRAIDGWRRRERLDERYAELGVVAFLAFSRHDGDLLDAGTNPVKYLTMGT